MIKKIVLRLRKSERGSQIVEFALIAPVLLLLVVGIIEFGWLFNGWIMLTGAAREGARVAAVDTNDANAEAAALAHTTTFDSAPDVRIIRGLNSDGDPDTNIVRCEITGNLRPLVGLFWSTDFVIDVDATMRREYSLE